MGESTSVQQSKGEEESKRSITVGGIASWIFGIVFGLIALTYLLELNIIPYIVSLIAMGITLPYTRRKIQNLFNVKFSRWVIVLSVIVLMIIAGIMT